MTLPVLLAHLLILVASLGVLPYLDRIERPFTSILAMWCIVVVVTTLVKFGTPRLEELLLLKSMILPISSTLFALAQVELAVAVARRGRICKFAHPERHGCP